MDARIVSNQVINSLQISVLKEVPPGNFNPGVNFLLKNISDDDVEVTIIPAGQKDSIKTILGVGWNPEICKRCYKCSFRSSSIWILRYGNSNYRYIKASS